MFGGQLLTMDGDVYSSGQSQPLSSPSGPYSSADYSSYSPSFPAASAGQGGGGGASSSSSSSFNLECNSTLAETGLSPPPPYSWDSSAPLLLPPEGGGAVSVSHYQDPLLQEPFSGDGRSYYDPGTAELAHLEDISRWDFDEIKRVATSLEASMLEDQREEFAASPFTWEEEAQANGGRSSSSSSSSSLFPSPELSPDASSSAQAGVPVGREGSYQRKTKMYQLGPQDDPEMEKRRKNAIKQHKKRVKDELLERNLRRTLNLGIPQVNQLKEEKSRRQQNIAMLQEHLARLSVGQHTPYQHGDIQQSDAGRGYFYQQ